MKLVGLGLLSAFGAEHPDCRKWIANWVADTRATRWATSHDVKARYPSASFLQTNVVIFNVRGNEYRLVTCIAYKSGVVVIKWIGTHDQYSKRHKRYEQSS